MGLTILLSVSAAVLWGTGDYIAGLQARRLEAGLVAFWATLISSWGLLLYVVPQGFRVTPLGALWALAAGGLGGVGLMLLYRGLASGLMAIVAPVTACASVIPVLVSVVVDRQFPDPVVAAGLMFAVAGVVSVSMPSQSVATAGLAIHRGAVITALLAAVAFGFWYVLIHESIRAGTSPPWTIMVARVGAVATLFAFLVGGASLRPPPRENLLPVISAGVFDVSANVAFAYASTTGQLGVVAVLTSLYPAVTVALSRVLLGEPIRLLQAAGITLVLLGIALIAAG